MPNPVPELKAPPRREFLGTIADVMAGLRRVGGLPAEFLMGDLPEYLDNASYGDARLWRGGLQTGKLAPGALDVAGVLPFAKIAALAKGVPAARGAAGRLAETAVSNMVPAGSRQAQRGVLRVGGDPELTLSHGTSLNSLKLSADAHGKPTLLSPSFALQRGGLANSFDRNVLLIPKANHLDPRLAPVTLMNRDFYSGRMSRDPLIGDSRRFLELMRSQPNWASSYRKKRMQGIVPGDTSKAGNVGMEGGLGVSGEHLSAIKASPLFSSFKHFEDSPQGAKLLMDLKDISPKYGRFDEAVADLEERLIKHHWQGVWDKLQGILDKSTVPGADYKFMQTQQRLLSEKGRQGFQMALEADLLHPEYEQLFKLFGKKAKTVPTSYAELQRHGRMPVNSDNFAGVITRDGVDPSELKKLLPDLDILSVPESATPASVKQLADQLQSANPPTKFLLK